MEPTKENSCFLEQDFCTKFSPTFTFLSPISIYIFFFSFIFSLLIIFLSSILYHFFFNSLSFLNHHYHLSLHLSHLCFLWFAFDFLRHCVSMCPFYYIVTISIYISCMYCICILIFMVKTLDMLIASSLNLL